MTPRTLGHQAGRKFFNTSFAGRHLFVDGDITSVNAYAPNGDEHPELAVVLAAAGQSDDISFATGGAEYRLGFHDGWIEARKEAIAAAPTKRTFKDVANRWRHEKGMRAARRMT